MARTAYDPRMNSPHTTTLHIDHDSGAVDMHWAFEQSADCIKIMGCAGDLMAMNRNGQCALEIDDVSTVIGKAWPQMWPEETQAAVRMAIATAVSGDISRFHAFCPTAKGTPRWWDVVVTPIRDSQGAVRSVLAVSRDVSAAHEAVQERVQLAARLEFTMAAAGFGEWELDMVTGATRCSARHGQCFGYPGVIPDWSAARMLAHVHPHDRARVGAALDDARLGNDLCLECRVIWPDASVHWISTQGSLYISAGQHDRMIGLVSDITDRMQTTEALHDASRKKDEFLAMLAHELRNPLAPISAAAQVITGGRANAALLEKAGAIIERQSRHMSHLLDDLLDVARVTQGLVTLDMQRIDLGAVVTAALEQARPMVVQYRHHLVVTLEPGPVHVSGDSERLVQVVANLLNNAAKYTPAGGHLTLALTAADGRARISVCDNGIGMAPSTLQQAFELFSQAARSSDRTSGGLGLGLALVKGLVERHGGSVSGRSDGPGCGSEFVVTLPLLAPLDAAPEPDAAVARIPGRLRLLIVDDNRDAAETLAMYLDMLGHETHVAFSGAEGLAQAGRLALDACLLDVGLPDMSGHDLARRLAALPVTPGAVLVAVTGYGSAGDRTASASAGFHHHMTKPVDTGELEALLARIGAHAA
jgi:PAS domain S-box-containing protein